MTQNKIVITLAAAILWSISSSSFLLSIPPDVLHPDKIFILPQQKTVRVAVDLYDAKHLDKKLAEQAIKDAVGIWNKALTGGVQLKQEAFKGNIPRNEMFITIESSNNPDLFKTSGNELGYTTMYVEKSRQIAQVKIMLNDIGPTKIFSTTGKLDNTYDLCLVVLHELGHAMGLGHDTNSTKYPPVMSPRLGTNRELNQWTNQPITQLRKLHPLDISLLKTALIKSEELDFAGTYEGTLTYEGRGNNVEFKDFKITQTKDKIVLNFKDNLLDAYAGASLYMLPDKKVTLTEISGWIKYVKIKKVGSDLNVELQRIISSSRKKYIAKGVLIKVDKKGSKKKL